MRTPIDLTANDLTTIDFKLLSEQKLVLLRLLSEAKDQETADALDGILNLLDWLYDIANLPEDEDDEA